MVAKWCVKFVINVLVMDIEGYGKTNMKEKNNNTMFECVNRAGEVEDEDFSYDYSGLDLNKLQ